jgi:hypothetical protein
LVGRCRERQRRLIFDGRRQREALRCRGCSGAHCQRSRSSGSRGDAPSGGSGRRRDRVGAGRGRGAWAAPGAGMGEGGGYAGLGLSGRATPRHAGPRARLDRQLPWPGDAGRRAPRNGVRKTVRYPASPGAGARHGRAAQARRRAWPAAASARFIPEQPLFGFEPFQSVRHDGPSSLDIRTPQRSGRLPLAFLRGVGTDSGDHRGPTGVKPVRIKPPSIPPASHPFWRSDGAGSQSRTDRRITI